MRLNTAEPASSPRPVPGGTGDGAMVDVMAGLWEQFRGTIMGRVAVVERAGLALRKGGLDRELRLDAEREAHKLAGSVGMFGFHDGTAVARKIEHFLGQDTCFGPEEVSQFSQMVVALRGDLERDGPVMADRARGGDAPQGQTQDDASFLLVIDRDAGFADLLATEGVSRGMRVEVAGDLAAARDAIVRQRPGAVLLDLSLADEEGDSLSVLSELGGASRPVPVLAMADGESFDDRLEVARLGGRGFLQRSSSPAQVLDCVGRLLVRSRPMRSKVMAVDDDPLVLAGLRAMLERRGFAVTLLETPGRFWETLNETLPDMLVLDVDLPGINGIDLCRVVRNEPRWSGLPVLFLTVRTDTETLLQVFAAGADDYVSKPIVELELLARITSHLERTRLAGAVNDAGLGLQAAE